MTVRVLVGIISVALALVIPLSAQSIGSLSVIDITGLAGPAVMENPFEVQELTASEVASLDTSNERILKAVGHLVAAKTVLAQAEAARKLLRKNILTDHGITERAGGCKARNYYYSAQGEYYSRTEIRGRWLLTTSGQETCYSGWTTDAVSSLASHTDVDHNGVLFFTPPESDNKK